MSCEECLFGVIDHCFHLEMNGITLCTEAEYREIMTKGEDVSMSQESFNTIVWRLFYYESLTLADICHAATFKDHLSHIFLAM